MKKIFFLIPALFVGNQLLAQPFENEKVNVKYYKPSMIEEAVPETFSLEVIQTLNGETSTIVAKDEGAEKEQYYYSRYKNVLKGSDLVANGGGFKLKVIQGEPKIVDSKPVNYNLKDANGVVTGTAWKMELKIEMSQEFTIENAEGKKIYKYLFPGIGAYSHTKYAGGATKFKSQAAAEQDLAEKEAWILSDHIKWNHRSTAQAMKNILKMDLQESTEKMELNVVVLDVGKKEREKYADVIALTDRMLAVFDKANDEYKSGSNMNWHTEAIKNEFTSLAADWEKLLTVEMENDENGKGMRFNTTVLQGLTKNQLWCEFFASNFAPVNEYAEKFLNTDNSGTAGTGFAAINDMRISWYKITYTTPQYGRVYDTCKTRMGWK